MSVLFLSLALGSVYGGARQEEGYGLGAASVSEAAGGAGGAEL